MRSSYVAIVIGLSLAGCSDRGAMMGNPAAPHGIGPSATPSTTYSSNGERIHFSATSASGVPISYTSGPFNGLGPMGCVMCHGRNGHRPVMWTRADRAAQRALERSSRG